MQKGEEGEEKKRREQRRIERKEKKERKITQEGNKDAAACLQLERQAHSFPFWGCHCRLVLSLWFVRRVNVTMLVRLF